MTERNDRFPPSLIPLLVDVASLQADPANARRHPERNLDAIRASLRRFGQQKPIVVDASGVVIAGSGTLEAARLEGWPEIAAVRSALLGPDRTAFGIADNRTAELAVWDEVALSALLASLGEDLEALGATGFSEDEIEEMTRVEPKGDPEKIPEPPAVARAQRGDLIGLGEHRLLCGDSTDPADVARLLKGETPLLMVTDPPYGVEYDPSWRGRAGMNLNPKKLGKVTNDDRADWTETWALFPGEVAYVYHAGVNAGLVQASLEAAGFEIRAQIVWAKDRMALSRGDYHWQHEPCWYAVKRGGKGHRTDDRTQSTLWQIPARDDDGHGHGTQKPVECMERPLRNHEGDAVFEPFAGSGTTLIAAERLGRRCFAMEIEPRYVDVIVQRWQEFTGKRAEGWRGNEEPATEAVEGPRAN